MKISARHDKQSSGLYARLAQRVSAEFTINDNGGLSAPSLTYGEVLGLFPLCLRIRGAIPSHLVRRGILEAVKALLASSGSLSANEFARIADNAVRTARKNPIRRFAMWSDLNLVWRQDDPTLRIGIDGAVVFLGPNLPKVLRDFPENDYHRSALFNRNERRSFIWGYKEASDPLAAGEGLDRAFSILQALVNIQSHLHNKVNPLPLDFRPASFFGHGPNYYLFDRDKSEWSNLYWIADENHEKLWRDTKVSSQKIASIMTPVRNHKNRLLSSVFKNRLVDALLNLNASWKSVTREGKATFLWMALEGLYSDQGLPCDQQTIIRRATHGLEGDIRFRASDRLRFVAELRNSKVHNFSQFNDADPSNTILQASNLYVVSCYLELLNIDQSMVRNENEFISFTELTANRTQLVTQKRLIDMAIQSHDD